MEDDSTPAPAPSVESDGRLREAAKEALLRSPAEQAAFERRWEVWCKKGANAKTPEGKIGVVTMDPDVDKEVKLRFADGEESDNIKADSLTQATPSDAGYEALSLIHI